MTAIEVLSLTHHYAPARGYPVTAVDRLSLHVPKGSIYGLIGPNGAGKTTTIRAICTLLTPSDGDVLVHGHSIRDDPRVIRRMLGYMPDSFGLYDELRLWEYLDFYGRCYRVAPAERDKTIDDVLELVDLGAKRDAYVAHLSRGMRQRLALARTLLHDPAVLVLDEPAAGLDPRARIELRELLRELQRMGKTILLSSHILSDLAEICSHVAILDRGRLAAEGPLQEVITRTRLPGIRSRRSFRIDVVAAGYDALRVLADLPHVQDAVYAAEGQQRITLRCTITGDDRDVVGVLASLVSGGVPVLGFQEERTDLEDVFLQLTAPVA